MKKSSIHLQRLIKNKQVRKNQKYLKLVKNVLMEIFLLNSVLINHVKIKIVLFVMMNNAHVFKNIKCV